MKLTDLKIGEEGIISEQNMELLPEKLLDFGCLPGNLIEVVNCAPFNGPVYLRVQESFFAIRKEIASAIEVIAVEEKVKA